MLLHIYPNRLIDDVQKDFNAVFPFLKIEFFKTRRAGKQDYSAHSILPRSYRIADAQNLIANDKIEIVPSM
ncbi:MAG TPA: hypothetical protein VLJ68_12095, partial [Chitinophagaceae bacterium]|nr:hypothetical protein [Chitinophagaceae bacterium]